MLSSSDVIIVDADALIAVFDTADLHAPQALSLVQAVIKAQATLLYLATALTEAITTLQRRLANPVAAEQIVAAIVAKHLLVETVDQDVLDLAANVFKPFGGKQNTFFDAIVLAIARKRNARAIFSFDEWYRKVGQPLIGDVI